MNLVLELFEEIYNIEITVGNYSLARDWTISFITVEWYQQAERVIVHRVTFIGGEGLLGVPWSPLPLATIQRSSIKVP